MAALQREGQGLNAQGESCEEADGHTVPYVLAAGDSKSLHFSFMAVQSRMDLNRPERLSLTYTRTMMGFLLFNAQPKSVAMIGLGGGSLARFILHHLPLATLKVVEINPNVVDLRREFLLPDDGERFKVRLGDGAEFVRAPPRRFDALLVDGFDVQGQPPELASLDFYRDCAECLAPEGVLVVNLCPAYAGFARQMSDIGRVFDGNVVSVYDDECSNTVVFASRAPLRELFVRHGWRCRRYLPTVAYEELLSALRKVVATLGGPELRREAEGI